MRIYHESLATVKSEISLSAAETAGLQIRPLMRAAETNLPTPNRLEPEALADFLPSNRQRHTLIRVLFILPLAEVASGKAQ